VLWACAGMQVTLMEYIMRVYIIPLLLLNHAIQLLITTAQAPMTPDSLVGGRYKVQGIFAATDDLHVVHE